MNKIMNIQRNSKNEDEDDLQIKYFKLKREREERLMDKKEDLVRRLKKHKKDKHYKLCLIKNDAKLRSIIS